MSAKSPESLPIDDDYDDSMDRDILKNTTFIYLKDAPNLINVLFDFRQYQPRPDVIIVDFLHTFFDYFSELDIDLSFRENFIECHMLMTAALHSAADMFCNVNTSTSTTTTDFMSIVCIDPKCNDIYKRFIETYIDLYYYKEGSILSFNDLKEKFPHQV